jgi:hypothetical protein
MRIPAIYVVASALLAAIVAPAVSATHSGLSVSGAWVRANAPGGDVAAAYFELRNASRQPATLTAISSDSAAHASVQATVIAKGISSMREMSSVELLAGETVRFQPGGMQVVLSGVQGQLRPGAPLRLTLSFADGTQLRVSATIKSLAGP